MTNKLKYCTSRFKSAAGNGQYKCGLFAQHEDDHECEMVIFSANKQRAKITITWPWSRNMGWMKITTTCTEGEM